jgi:hypothetical protein
MLALSWLKAIMNAMTQAFHTAFINGKHSRELEKIVVDYIRKQPKFQEGWSLKTSYKTYQVLKHQGIAK